MVDEPSDHLDSTDVSGMGERIRRFRKDKQMSLSQLAERATVSKGYLSALENADAGTQDARRPSAKTLYSIAQALGVTMSDLLGRKLLLEIPDGPVPEGLRQLVDEDKLPASDLQMLSSIRFRGEPPKTIERWRYIYNAIRTSEGIDKD